MIRHGILGYDPKEGLKFYPGNVKPLEKYPHSNSDDLTGAISILETPHKVKDSEGKLYVPSDMYLIVVDSYKKDNAEDKTSLGAAYVYKLENDFTSHVTDIPIAWYVARPNRLKEFLDNLFKLAEYYNSTIQGENDGGGEAIISYARHNKLLHRLEFEPEMLHNKEMASNNKNKNYLMNVSTQRVEIGLLYFADYLTEKIGTDEAGNPIQRIHKIFCIGLLQEIAKFRPDRNADRISANIIYQFMRREKHEIRKKKLRKSKSDFWNRPLYSNDSHVNKNFKNGMIMLN
jgi:hypothetical protein